MKSIIYYITLLASVMMLTGCNFLEPDDNEKMSGDEFWDESSAENVEGFVNSMYYSFRKATMQNSAFILYSGDLRCAPISTTHSQNDNDWKWVGFLATNDLNGLRQTYSSDKDYRADGIMRWSTFYEVIQQANILLQEIKRTKCSDSEKRAFSTEAVFMRALSYFFLVRNFGDVPYYTDAYHQEPLPRTNMVDVLKAISVDLQSSLDANTDQSVLPWTHSNSYKKGVRATRASYLALLMHINMWLAGFDKNMSSEYYQNVVKYGDELVNHNEGQYSLIPIEQYSSIFLGGSSEGIFEISQNVALSSSNEAFKNEAIFSNVVNYRSFSSKSVSDIYYSYDFMTNLFPVMEDDRRKDLWFDENLYAVTNEGQKEILKFLNPDTYGNGTVTSNSGNQIVFRLADAILLYAEALAELGSDDATANTLLNSVRRRAGAQEVNASGDALKEAIYWERVRELIGEGHYFYDLVRTEKLCDSRYCYNPIRRSEFNSGAWTWPISRSALDNNTKISLNLYWE